MSLQAPASAAVVAERAKPLGVLFKTAYGLGQFVESVATALLNVFLFFYITTVCGLSGSLTGLALFLALTVDAVADPVVGSLSDNLSTRWGRRIPPMAVSLVPIAVSLGLLFSIPHLSGWALFAYVLTLLTCLRVSLSGFIIPYWGLGAELSDDYDERSSIVAFRAIFGMVATLIPYVLSFLFLSGAKGLLDRAGYAPFGWTNAVVLFVGGALATYASLRALPRLHGARPSGHRLWRRLFGEVAEVFRNRSFVMLFVGVLMFFVGQGVFITLSLHAYRYFWVFDGAAIKWILISSVLGLALGLPIAFALIGRVEKRGIVLWCIAAICVLESLPALARIFGLLPGAVRTQEIIVVACTVAGGAVTTLVAIAFQSAMADAVDEHEMLFATRREGLYFASLSFASKAALGLGSLVSGVLLDLIAFPAGEIAAGKHVIIAANVSRDLGLAYGPVAALITLISVVIFAQYRLDRAAHAAVRNALGR